MPDPDPPAWLDEGLVLAGLVGVGVGWGSASVWGSVWVWVWGSVWGSVSVSVWGRVSVSVWVPESRSRRTPSLT